MPRERDEMPRICRHVKERMLEPCTEEWVRVQLLWENWQSMLVRGKSQVPGAQKDVEEFSLLREEEVSNGGDVKSGKGAFEAE